MVVNFQSRMPPLGWRFNRVFDSRTISTPLSDIANTFIKNDGETWDGSLVTIPDIVEAKVLSNSSKLEVTSGSSFDMSG